MKQLLALLLCFFASASFAGVSGNGPIAGASDGTPIGNDADSLKVSPQPEVLDGSYPDPSSMDSGSQGSLNIDQFGNLQVRGAVISDEGSFRDDFPGSALTTTLTGTITFTAASPTLTGSGTSFSTQVIPGQYIKKTADGEVRYLAVETVNSDTSITLAAPYGGTTAATTAVVSNWQPSTGTGSSFTVGSSLLNLVSGTTSGSKMLVQRAGDYLPYNVIFNLSLTQRIANQTTVVGMQDTPGTPASQAVIVFDGTDNTKAKCRSSFDFATDVQETTMTIPSLGTSAVSHTYEIDLTSNQVTCLIDGIVLATHKNHLPGPYKIMSMTAYIANAATVTTTTAAIDSIYFANLDQLQVTNDFVGEPLKVSLMGKSATTGYPTDLNLDGSGNLIVTSLTGFNSVFSFGDITSTATTQQAVRRTAYTEQAVNGPWSIGSSSALDTGGGTGARQVTITYLTQTGAGPFSETVTLNGTTFVNFAAQMCFVEKIQVIQAGSTGSNAGILTLKNAQNGTGSTITTIAATDNQTYFAHHYVASSKTTKVTGISVSHNGTTAGSGALFVLKSIPVGSSNVTELIVSDFVRLYGQSSTFSRAYTSPISVSGPAKITLYTTPETGTSTIYRGSFDFFEQ